jgi:hypothetical protein
MAGEAMPSRFAVNRRDGERECGLDGGEEDEIEAGRQHRERPRDRGVIGRRHHGVASLAIW